MASEPSISIPKVVCFDGFEADLAAGELYKHGLRIHLRGQSFQVLSALLERPGEIVTREELRCRLWGGEVFVDFENDLNTVVARLRQILCDNAEQPRLIETVPRRGYRFIGEVHGKGPGSARKPARVRLIVLPFLNLSGDPGEEYFSDAMTDEVITALAGLMPEDLAVIARTTAMHYKKSDKDVARIGEELKVGYVVEGGVRQSGDHVSVSVQLVQTSDQTYLFTQKFEAEMRGIFSLHNRIAQAITRHIPITEDVSTSAAVRTSRKPTESLAAYNEYIKGRFEIYRLTSEGTMEAKRHFEAALTHDPNFALACNSLAELYWYLGMCGFAPCRETDPVGKSYALRAMRIDSSSADTHAIMSFFPGKRDDPMEIDYYDWEQIKDHIAQARGLDPYSRLVRVRHAMVLTELGDPEQAVAELEVARESDPLSLDVNAWLAIFLYLAGHPDRALEHAVRVRELEPQSFVSYDVLGQAYLALHRYDESAAAFEESARISQLPLMLGWVGLALGLGGRTDEARSVLHRLQKLARQRYVLPTSFAWVHFGLGEIDQTFLWLDRAVDAPDRMMEGIQTYPFLDPIRSDPRFTAVLRKMNLV